MPPKKLVKVLRKNQKASPASAAASSEPATQQQRDKPIINATQTAAILNAEWMTVVRDAWAKVSEHERFKHCIDVQLTKATPM